MVFADAVTQNSVWNSLEIAKLAAAVLTPVSVLVFGFWLNRRLKGFEHLQWSRQKVIEKRLCVFEELAPLLNDLLCYFTYIGSWKEFTPECVLKLKRRVDRIAYVNAALFPAEFLSRYNAFVGLCYETYAGWGRDARLRTKYKRRADAFGDGWNPTWSECFSDENECTDVKKLRDVYHEFIACFAKELGIGVDAAPITTGRPPANIR